MKYKKLGQTKDEIPAIGQGCMGIGGEFSMDVAEDQKQIKALRLGIDLGMTFIDTAEVYGGGHSEEVVAKSIHGIRHQVFIATKFSPKNNGFDDVLKSAELSLKRLNTDYIDLYQVHWPNPTIPVEETIRAMETLLQQGKARYLGVNNFSVRELQQAQNALGGNKLVSNQVEYNLFDRFIEGNILPYCEDHKYSVIAYSPLDKGKLAPRQQRLQEIAQEYEKSVSQVILNWLICRSPVVVIPKALNVNHIRENAEASDFVLSEEHRQEIDSLFPSEPHYIDPKLISVSTTGDGNRKVYQTLEDALKNPLNFVPSPSELAEVIKQGEPVKPVRLTPNTNRNEGFEYDLIEGRIRYWAWVIAFNSQKPVPSYIRN
jgi:diketogulonate reductase-like aldo/keto reductase